MFTPATISLDRISVQPGFNPRTFVPDSAIDSLADSIRKQGLIQSIVVRPRADADGFWVVAGETRFRAASRAGLSEIECRVVDADDRTARQIALDENDKRRDISPGDEARALRRLLDQYEGDRTEVANRLGWSASKVASRLALLQASDTTLDALAQDTIRLGHAELLAALPHEVQAKVLPKVIEQNLSVQQLKESLDQAAIPLASAIFDRKQCVGCAHNSEVQSSLFASALDAGNPKCSNRGCFAALTKQAIDARKAELEERYPLVALASERADGTSCPVTASDVGPTQISACRGCGSYGAVLEDRQNGRCGEVSSGICFNLKCRQEKVEAHREAQRPAPVPVAVSVPAPASGAAGAMPSPTPAARTKATTSASPSRLRPVLRDRYDAALRQAAQARCAEEPTIALSVFLLAMHKLFSPTGIDALAHPHEQSAAKLASLPMEGLQAQLAALAAAFLGQPSGSHEAFQRARFLACLAEHHPLDIAAHFTVDEALLKGLTISEIHALLDESGFRKRVLEGQDGEAKWKRLSALRKDDLIATVVASKFDFSGFVPASFAEHLKQRRKGS